MKKMIRRAAVLATALILAFAMTAVYVCADYDHEIRISAGNKGSISSYDSKGDRISVDGDKILVDDEETDFALNDDAKSKYYVKGLKVTGEDNSKCFQSIDKTTEDKDISVVAVYGLKGAMVKYTVNYVDESGSELASSEEFYGMPGDKPVVSYRYINGYLPNAYTEGKTLSENEADNVFTFTYYDATAEDTVIEVDDGTETTGGGTSTTTTTGGTTTGTGTGTGTGAGDGTGAADGTTIGDNDTPLSGPEDYVDLDDDSTPLVDGSESAESEGSGVSAGLIAGGAAIVAAIAAAAFVIAKRRREYEYEDDEDE